MLDIKYIRENKELIRQTGIDKNFPIYVDLLLELDKKIVDLNKSLDELKT